MSGTFPDEQHDLLEDVAKRLHQIGIRYFVTGSQASTLYGEPRFTLDIDIVIELAKENVSQLIELFRSDEFYRSESEVSDAVER